MWFWISYLQTRQNRYIRLALVTFILTFLTKESSITLPVTLFLIDRCLVQDRVGFRALIYRYLPFALLVIAYLGMEYSIQRNGLYVSYAKYGIGGHMLTNLWHSLTGLVFP